MLLWLTEFLSQYVGGFSVFQYLTLRTMVSVITALAVSLMIGPSMIAWLGRSQIGQQVRTMGQCRISVRREHRPWVGRLFW